MTLRLIEGFDFMPTGLSDSERQRLLSAKNYYCDSNGLFVSTNSRFNFGKSLSIEAGTGLNQQVVGNRIPTGVAVAEGYVGVAVYVGANPEGRQFVSFFDGVNALGHIFVSFLGNGIIRVARGNGGGSFYGYTGQTVLAYSDVGTFQEEQWFYLEVHGKVDGSAGSIEVRVNTKTVISLPAVNTLNGTRALFDVIAVGYNYNTFGFGSAKTARFDDLYFCDTAGSANNNFLGNCRVMTQFVAGNSTPQNFTIGGTSPAATAWQSLLNTALDDTKYIADGTAGDRSLFTLETIINTPMVFGTQLSGAYRMDDATQRVVGNVLKSGGTTATGADHYINQTYTFYKDLWELNPATGVGFTGAELNALLVGPNVNV